MSAAGAPLRRARQTDAPALARLVNIAGEGLPMWIWEQGAAPGQHPLEFGISRATRESGGFSYRNAWVFEADAKVVALLLSYRLDDPYDVGNLDEMPAVVRPAVELESCAAGSWYINAIATMPEWRGKGLGGRLLEHAETLAREAGANQLSLIVDSANPDAKRLYERHGYQVIETRACVPFADHPPGNEWLLMVKSIDA